MRKSHLPSPFRSTITREEINRLPVGRYQGPIRMFCSPPQIAGAVRELKRERVLGFDIETRAAFRKGEVYPPALVQLAGSQAVYLFRLGGLRGLGGLAEILADRRVLKVGVSLAFDIKKLQALEHFEPAGFVELEKVTDRLGVEPNGLRALSAIVLGLRITKGAQRSNWSLPHLLPAQVNYAATDAWACRAICLKLEPYVLITGGSVVESTG